jgi:hypothetical protein
LPISWDLEAGPVLLACILQSSLLEEGKTHSGNLQVGTAEKGMTKANTLRTFLGLGDVHTTGEE